MKDVVFFVYLNQKLSLGHIFGYMQGRRNSESMGGGQYFLKIWEGGAQGGKCGSEVGIISPGRMTVCLLPDFFAQWVEKNSEADVFFLILCFQKYFIIW